MVTFMHQIQFSLRLAIALGIVFQAAPAIAERATSVGNQKSAQSSSLLRIQLEHQRIGIEQNMIVGNEFLRPHFANDDLQLGEDQQYSTTFKQYDAAVVYPMAHMGLDIGIGVNLRLIDGMSWTSEDGQYQSRNFSEAIPMFYASALLNLPFEGLSAGFEGRHSDSLINGSFDYKAKLRYEWSNSVGFEGSWHHQQYTDDRLNVLQDNNESNSLFLDMRLKF